MGHICSCQRAEKSWYKEKDTPYDVRLSAQGIPDGAQLSYDPNNYWAHQRALPVSVSGSLTSSVYATTPRRRLMKVSSVDYPYTRQVSSSTLSPESGFASKASSTLDTTASRCASAPASPRGMIRRKPPPKPPRMRGDSRYGDQTPTPSMRSDVTLTLKSSLVDVASLLESTLSRSFEEDDKPLSPTICRYNLTSASQEKVYSILAQTKEFLAFELDPDPIIGYLVRKSVISRETEVELYKASTPQTRCEYLIDVITAKGYEEFVVFCEALRRTGCHGYLADFLLTLDVLVELATANIMKPTMPGSVSQNSRRAFSFESKRHCPMCICSNNNTYDVTDNEFLGDTVSFDIDIIYVNRDTGETRGVREVAAMKRRKRPLSVDSADGAILEEADKYIPVLCASLYNQCMSHGGVDTLAPLLRQYQCIRELTLVKVHLNSDSLDTLCSALAQNKGLVFVDLRLNNIGQEGVSVLAETLPRHPTLRTLKLTSTGLSGQPLDNLITAVFAHPTIGDFDMGFNELSEANCEVLSKCLVANQTMRRLRLRCNGITPYGSRCIFKRLKKNSRMSYLDISRNRVRDESMATLSEMLLHNRTLRDLNLENCQLTGESCGCLARALKTNTGLRTLDLSMNRLGNLGAKAIAEGLKYNQVLEVLCLNMCNIGNTGFLAILEAMRFNSNMTCLKLCYNNIGRDSQLDKNNRPCTTSSVHPQLSPGYNVYENATVASDIMRTSSPRRPKMMSLPSFPSSPISSFVPSSVRSMMEPLSPNAQSLRRTFVFPPSDDKAMDILYDSLCAVLQQNRSLKVLLWGNNFDDRPESPLLPQPGPQVVNNYENIPAR